MNNADPKSPAESHILDEIPIYLAGGLNATECERVESHIAGCPECGAAMVDAKAMDASLHTLFDKMAPDRGFEDRLIARFREKTTRRALHPMVRRAAIGVAASILLGSVGFYAQRNMGRLEHIRAASSLQQMGSAMALYSAVEGNGYAVVRDSRAQAITSAASPTTQPASINVGSGINLNGGIFTLDGRTITLKEANVSGGMVGKVAVPQRTPAFFDTTKSGAGTLSLSGQNTYSGGTTITNGTLTASGAVSGSGKEQRAAGNQQGQNIAYGDGHTKYASSGWAANYRPAPCAR